MLVSINSVSVPTTAEDQEIRIFANDVESLLLADDLFETAEAREVVFKFEKSNMRHRKYLLKILQNVRAAKGKSSFGAMLESLPNSIISLNEAFLEH